jgi:hypothetical protein
MFDNEDDYGLAYVPMWAAQWGCSVEEAAERAGCLTQWREWTRRTQAMKAVPTT